MSRPFTPLIERFRKYAPTGTPKECWEWTGFRDNNGYGRINSGGHFGKPVLAHRIAALGISGFNEPVTVLHKCDNPPCVNPNHLIVGTQSDNVTDAMRKGRMYKICDDDMVAAIRSRTRDIPRFENGNIAKGFLADIASEFGVSRQVVAYWMKNDKRGQL
jgi:HNH endonuclease